MNYLYLIVFLIVIAFVGYQYRGYLLLNDITTTPENSPEYGKIQSLPENQNRDLHYDKSNADLQKEQYPELTFITLPFECSKAFKIVAAQAEKMRGWKIIDKNPDNLRIEAVSETRLMHFQDDIVIELRPVASGCTVNMRSKSRIGKGDLGTNARRIESFLKKIQTQTPSD